MKRKYFSVSCKEAMQEDQFVYMKLLIKIQKILLSISDKHNGKCGRDNYTLIITFLLSCEEHYIVTVLPLLSSE